MKAKGLQNWMGILSLVLLVIVIISLFTNWLIYEKGYEILPGELKETVLSNDYIRTDLSADNLFRLLDDASAKGISPYTLLLMFIVVVRFVIPIGEEAIFVGLIWALIILFAALFALLIKLIIQRILGKKAKGILAFAFYGVLEIVVFGLGTTFADIMTPWAFVGLPAMLASIVLWTIYCRKVGITRKRGEPAYAMPYDAQAPYMPMQPVAPSAIYCGKCGTQLQPGTVFCGRCGAQQQPQMQQPAYQPAAQPYSTQANRQQPQASSEHGTQNTPL